MRVAKNEYVPDGDILLLRFAPGKVARTIHREPEVMVDLDERGAVLSIEIVGVKATTFDVVKRVFEEFGVSIGTQETVPS